MSESKYSLKPYFDRIRNGIEQVNVAPNPVYRPYVRMLWLFYVVCVGAVFTLFTLISMGLMGYMPSFEELENPQSDLASEVFTDDGQMLGKFYRENRSPIRYNDLSPNLVHALLATEDARFYDHSGIDPRGLFRVAVKTVLMGQDAGGGSTITQQLAKNLYPRDTTQYANVFAKIVRLGSAKFKEWVTAVKLERNYTKTEIMAMYLNTVAFGQNAYGVKAAARTYFDTTPDSLRVEQAAVLVGLLKGPSVYNPVTSNPVKKERAIGRRNTVLGQMEKYDFLSEAAYDSITKQPIVLKLNRSTHLSGLAPYLREFLRLNLTAKEPIRENYHSAQSWLEDSTEWATNPLYGWCNKNRKSNNDFYNLYQDGLRVYTTIDSRMQTYAEEAMEEHMPEIQTLFSKQKGQDKGWGERGPYSSKLSKDDVERILHQSMLRSERYRSMYVAGASKEEIEKSFNEPTDMTVFSWHGERDTVMTPMDSIRYYKYYLSSGFMSVEPATGYVRAYVGGLNYKYFKYDHVTVAKRQVGSTFKPFIYTLAMQAGYSPCHEVPNIDYTFEMPEGQSPRTYTPQFSTNQYISYTNGRMVSLKFGLANSMNQISAWVLKQYSPDAAIAIARAMGVRSRLDPVPSLCTGAAEASLYEMVGAYTSFVNKGIYSRPVFVSRIEDKHGNVLASFKSKQSIAISEETAFKMVSMMQGVVDYGTSQRLRYKYKFTNPIAGKTGTTNDNSDGWFIGMIPNLVSGAWVGGEERSIRFGNTLYGQGASMALPIWALYMTKVYADPHLKYSKEAFPVPNGFDVSALDCKQYKNDQENNKDNYSQGNEEY